jgi:hypothetical protein
MAAKVVEDNIHLRRSTMTTLPVARMIGWDDIRRGHLNPPPALEWASLASASKRDERGTFDTLAHFFAKRKGCSATRGSEAMKSFLGRDFEQRDARRWPGIWHLSDWIGTMQTFRTSGNYMGGPC